MIKKLEESEKNNSENNEIRGKTLKINSEEKTRDVMKNKEKNSGCCK